MTGLLPQSPVQKMKNRTLLYGEGLFETFRVYRGGKLAFVDDHLDRMAGGCRFFSLPFSRGKAAEALCAALKEIPHQHEARLRLDLISRGDHGVEETEFETSWEELEGDCQWGRFGVRLALSPIQRFSRSPLVRFKTSSYLENIFVFSQVRRNGFFDALFTNERGEITEGAISNIFFLGNGRISTPPLEAGLLPGVTRKQVIEVAQSLDLSVRQSTITPADLKRFDGAFVTNSVVEILPVAAVGETGYEIPEITRALLEGYKRRAEGFMFCAA